MARRTRNHGDTASADWWHGRPDPRQDLAEAIPRLTAELAQAYQALGVWQQRLALRTAWEQHHPGPSELAALRQETAACHCRCLDLERRLLQARAQLRILRGSQESN